MTVQFVECLWCLKASRGVVDQCADQLKVFYMDSLSRTAEIFRMASDTWWRCNTVAASADRLNETFRPSSVSPSLHHRLMFSLLPVLSFRKKRRRRRNSNTLPRVNDSQPPAVPLTWRPVLMRYVSIFIYAVTGRLMMLWSLQAMQPVVAIFIGFITTTTFLGSQASLLGALSGLHIRTYPYLLT